MTDASQGPEPRSIGETVAAVVDLVVGVAAAVLLRIAFRPQARFPVPAEFAEARAHLAHLERQVNLSGLALLTAGALLAAALLLTRRRLPASAFQIVALFGGVLVVCAYGVTVPTALSLVLLIALALFTVVGALRDAASTADRS